MSVAGGYSPRAVVAPIVGTFYKKLGVETNDDERHYKFQGEAFERLAGKK